MRKTISLFLGLLLATVVFADTITSSAYTQTGGAEGHPDSVHTAVNETTGGGVISDSDGDTGYLVSDDTLSDGTVVQTYAAKFYGGQKGSEEKMWRTHYSWMIIIDGEEVIITKSKWMWNDDNDNGKVDEGEAQINDFSEDHEGQATYVGYSTTTGGGR